MGNPAYIDDEEHAPQTCRPLTVHDLAEKIADAVNLWTRNVEYTQRIVNDGDDKFDVFAPLVTAEGRKAIAKILNDALNGNPNRW